MKKIVYLVVASFFAFSLSALAQDDDNVRFDKTRRGPDENGVYTLSLEAYVTGAVTVSESPAPADIVLVLDKSGSMLGDLSGASTNTAKNQRINILRAAVQRFVESVRTSDAKIAAGDKDDYGGHRIAIIWFSGKVNLGYGNSYSTYDVIDESITGLNEFLPVSDLRTVAESTSGSYSAAKVLYNNANLLGVSTDRYNLTITDKAMQRAKSVLSTQDYSDKPNRSRVVVFFTDGDPGWNATNGWQNDSRMLEIADGCISAANDIKNSELYSATVYSVGLFNKAEGTKDATTTYLSYTSSDYTDKTQMPSSSSYVSVTGDKSIVVSSSDGLSNALQSIAHSSTPTTTAASASSVLIDIVSTSFKFPENADLGTVQVYEVKNIQADQSSMLNWAPRNQWINLTDDLGDSLHTDPDTGEVSVTGFDYGENWCGWDASYVNDAGQRVGRAHGSKLVLEIPIMANEEAVGGPNVATNAPGSMLVIRDAENHEISTHEFISPVISLPVNMHIMKKGLKAGESAKFIIRRTTAPITSSSVWEYVSSVFVTNGQSSPSQVIMFDGEGKIAGVLETGETAPDGYSTESNPVCYVRGLPPAKKNSDDSVSEYVYKIEEDTWGWRYTFDEVIGLGVLSIDEETNAVNSGPITISNKNEVYSNKFVSNPIIFCNTRETDVDQRVRNAESKATNIFTGGGSVKYDDSKKNTGTGR